MKELLNKGREMYVLSVWNWEVN